VWFAVTLMLTFHDTDLTISREYKKKTFQDTWSCHEFISDNKMMLLSPHIELNGDNLKGFEFFCESRYGEEV